MPSTKRLLSVLPAAALLATALTVPPAAGQAATAASYQPSASDYYVNYAPPRVEPEPGEPAAPDGRARAQSPARAFGSKHSGGNPVTARILAARENQAIRTGRNPADFIHENATRKRNAKLLTLLVEFNENAADDFSGFNRPRTVNSPPGDCATEPPGTRKNGPLHNRIPDPATLPKKDDNSFWVKDFSPEHFSRLLYSDQGITQRVRPDLRDPRDGRPGIDVSGFTMKRMYEEMSKGAYSVTGSAFGWIKAPHSEAWYGAASCGGAPQDMSGHPGNPAGAGQLAIDAVDMLALTRPGFPWADYDVEDVSDADGDGDHAEPDGVIDHLVLVHAGKDKSADGGAEGTYAVWAHAGAVAGGHQVPGTGKKISNYIVAPEDSGVGVFAHEYGHDLGLPDLHDASGAAGAAVDFWDLMSSGSHSGPLYQSMPAHMGLWGKWVLGWADPKVFGPGDAPRHVTVGQSSRTPGFAQDGVRVNLPLKTTGPHSGARFYLAEWRNFDGFDKGLRYAYDTTYARDGAWKVEKVSYNAPGLLVWYRDSAFTGDVLVPNLELPPSIGSKGGLILVDSHFDPLRRIGTAAEKDPSRQKNLEGRSQTSNAAFSFTGTYPFKECLEALGEPFSEYCTDVPPLAGVLAFTDAKGWYPGFEARGGRLFYRDFDASAVVPSNGDRPYSTRVVHLDGTPATELYGTDLGNGHKLGTGDPGDEGRALGVRFKLISPLPHNLGAIVQVVPPMK